MHKLIQTTLGISIGLLLPLLVSAQEEATGVSVPHHFASGTPARAQDVNENFQALTDAINTLTTQVAALQDQLNAGGGNGPVTAESLVGKYWLVGYATEHEAWGNSGSIGQFLLDGEITLAANGTVAFQGNEASSRIDFSNVETGGQQHLKAAIDIQSQPENLSGTWTYNAGQLNISFGDGGLIFRVSSTGEVLVLAEKGRHGAIRVAIRLPE